MLGIDLSPHFCVVSIQSNVFLSLSIPLYMSLIKSTNNKGPSMEPWGTPDNTSMHSEAALSNITLFSSLKIVDYKFEKASINFILIFKFVQD